MPNAEKAILNPFDPLSIPQALMVAVCGILVVFMMLAILAVVIVVISKVVGAMEGKKKPAAPARSDSSSVVVLALYSPREEPRSTSRRLRMVAMSQQVSFKNTMRPVSAIKRMRSQLASRL